MGLRRSTRRITTMPNNECPKKNKITADADKALADLKKVTDAQPELELKLKSVKDSLTGIKMDNHKL
jgi:metal-sulfur cluster biosynthetic enzyme